MTLYRGPGGTGSATSDADTTLYQDFLNQTIAARDAALQAEINAELAETNAETAETNAETAETNAETAATNAASSASAAASSASSASTSASNASTSASAAATSATAAASSASSASSSASAASTSASNAATSATNAANSASSASTSATNAANSASTATTQATNAASSATAAASSASSASTSATNAANSASAASTSATNAATSATSAASSATAAAASAASIDASTLVRTTGDQTIGGTKTFSSNPIISAGTVNGVAYLNGSKVLTSGSSLVFDGTNLGVGTSSTLGNSTVNAVLGFVARNSGASMGYFQTYNANAGVGLKTWRFGGDGSGNLVFETVNDAYSSATQRLSLSSAGNLTLPAGTANGVAYLNGSKVLTTGSALTFDGTNNLAFGNGGSTNAPTSLTLNATDNAANGSYILGRRNGSNAWLIGDTASSLGTGTGFTSYNYGTAPWIWFLQTGGEQMRLTSTGLGIGTSSPAYKLDVAGTVNVVNGSNGRINIGATNNYLYGDSSGNFIVGTSGSDKLQLTSSGNLGIGTSSPVGRLTIQGAAGTNGINQGIGLLYSNGTQFGAFGLNNSSGWPQLMARAGAGLTFHVNSDLLTTGEAMRLDQSGNLGLGVTPSAWGSGFRAFQANRLAFQGDTSNGGVVGANGFFDGSAWRYVASDFASLHRQSSGQHQFFTAPSGTAGNAISFTQAMTLDASGNVQIGTTSGAARLKLQAPAGNALFHATDGTRGDFFIDFPSTEVTRLTAEYGVGGILAFANGTSKTERARIHSSGQFSTGTTSTNGGQLTVGGSMGPSTDNASTCANAFYRWSVVYAATGTINTSDAREKTPVRSLNEAEIAAAQQIASEIGAYKWLSAVAEKGDAAREHIGMTVQRAIEIMESNGLTPFNYGFICYDENEETSRYSFRMDELAMFISRGQQAIITQLKADVAALKGA